MTFDTVRELALGYPGVEEGPCYGTPAFRVRGKLLARLREDGETLVLKVDPFERDMLLETEPGTFYTTDHYRGYPVVLVRLPVVSRERLEELIGNAWRSLAPKRLVRSHGVEA
jgi:hypothetical protein